jgi:hypothetical protein
MAINSHYFILDCCQELLTKFKNWSIMIIHKELRVSIKNNILFCHSRESGNPLNLQSCNIKLISIETIKRSSRFPPTRE